MAKKVAILVDGQNLYYSLREIGVKEIEIKWNDFFNSLLAENEELVRAYWFRPQKVHDHHVDINITHKCYVEKYHAEKKDEWKDEQSTPKEIFEKIKKEYQTSSDWYNEFKKRFSTGEYKYDQLANSNENIEIVKAGIVKLDVFNRIPLGEKGVDVSLCVKMMKLAYKNNIDKIILISGDFDTAEAVKAVKDDLKTVHIVKFHKGYPPTNKNLSKDLSVLADKILNVYEKDIRDKYLIPPTIVSP